MADYQNNYNYDQIVGPAPPYPVQSADAQTSYYQPSQENKSAVPQLTQQNCPTIVQTQHPPQHQEHIPTSIQTHNPPLLQSHVHRPSLNHRLPSIQDSRQPHVNPDHCPPPIINDHCQAPIHQQPARIHDHHRPPVIISQHNLYNQWPVHGQRPPIPVHSTSELQSQRPPIHNSYAISTCHQDQHTSQSLENQLIGGPVIHSNHPDHSNNYDTNRNDSYNYPQLPIISNPNETDYDSSHNISAPALPAQQHSSNPQQQLAQLDSNATEYPPPLSDNTFMKHNQTNYNQTPTSADACMSIVQSLMMHRCGETESFSKRAIESLVKKMKEKRDELDALITAITTSGTNPSKCVTIQRTLDGRLQVAGKKGFPHVIYARIWRWPDLNKNELKHNGFCAHAFDLKSDLVCVNPYHYERIVASGLDLSSLSLSSHDADDNPSVLVESTSSNSPPSSVPPTASPESLHSSTISQTMPSLSHFDQQQTTLPNPIAQPPRYPLVDPIHQVQPILDTIPNSQPLMSPHVRQCSAQPLPEYWCSIAYFELDQQIGETFKVAMNCPVVSIDGYTDPSADDKFCLGALLNVHRLPAVEKARCHIGRGVTLEMCCEGDVWLENKSENSIFLNSPFLSYNHSQKNGPVHEHAVHKVYPSCRKLKVFDLCYTQEQLFARARAEREAEARQSAAVTGVASPSSSANHISNSELSSAVGVDDLRKLCMLSISFVKGWGADYPSRLDIKKCPCWIQVTLHRALQVLDEVLQQN